MKKPAALLCMILLACFVLVACGTAPVATTTAQATTKVTAQTAAQTTVASSAAPTQATTAKPAAVQTDTYLCVVIRSLSNPFHQQVVQGVKQFAKEKGFADDHVVVLTYEASSEKQLNDIKTWVTKTNGNCVFMVDPAQKSDLISIAEYLEQQKVYWVSIWERPKEVKLTDYKYWVSAINFDNLTSGYASAKALFESMGGKGKVWVVQGTAGHAATISRGEGFAKALKEYPNIVKVGEEDCAWEKTKGFNSANNALAANPDITGIWGANDNMAIGALEAIRGKNMIGKVTVAGVNAIPDMITAIKNGEAAATISTDPLWQGGISMAMCLDAKSGKYDITKVDEAHRYWLAGILVVNKANVNDYLNNYLNGNPKFDWSNYFADKYLGPGL